MKHKPGIAAVLAALVPLSSMAQGDDSWEFSLSPLFIWGMSIDGDTQAGGAVMPLDLSFKDDLFDNMTAAFTLHLEARKGRWTAFAEYQGSRIEPTASLGPLSVDVEFTSQMGELGASYAVWEGAGVRWELLAGARYTNQDIDVETQLTLPPGPVPINISSGDDWWDGFVGGRALVSLGENWGFVGRADVGGGGSDSVLNASFLFDWRFKQWGSAMVGYRWMKFDYQSGSGADLYAYDAVQQGPLLGITFHW